MAQQSAMAIDGVLAEHADLERQLSDPALHGDAGNARRVGRRFAQLAPIVRPTASSKPPAATSRPPASWPPRTRRSPQRCPSWKPGSPSSTST